MLTTTLLPFSSLQGAAGAPRGGKTDLPPRCQFCAELGSAGALKLMVLGPTGWTNGLVDQGFGGESVGSLGNLFGWLVVSHCWVQATTGACNKCLDFFLLVGGLVGW